MARDDSYRTIEKRFGPGAKVPGHRGGSAVEKVGGQLQKKLTPKEQRQATGEHMRHVAREMERKANKSKPKVRTGESGVIGVKTKFE